MKKREFLFAHQLYPFAIHSQQFHLSHYNISQHLIKCLLSRSVCFSKYAFNKRIFESSHTHNTLLHLSGLDN